MSDENQLPESSYPELQKPDFKSDIPPHLLHESTEGEKWIFEQLSVTKQFIEWSVDAHLKTHSAVRRTNGRLKKVEAWKEMFSSWWVLAGAIFTIIAAAAGVVEVISFVAEKWPK